MVTLVQLVAAVGPALVPVTDAARGPVELSGIHISELTDPTPYLEGGEILLTTGIPFTDPAVSAADYVARLRDRGVAALVVGVGPKIDEIPPALIEQCRETRFPLLLVPDDQPFVRVTRAYWELVAASGRATLVAQLGTQTALVREAGKPEGIAGVVSLVAQAVGGWAAYVPLHVDETHPAVVWPDTLSGLTAGLQAEVRRFAERGNVGAATFPLHGYDVIAHPVATGAGTGSHVRGAFAVGVGRRPSPADRQLILTATAVLGLREAAQGDAVTLDHAVGEAVVNLLLSGEVTAAQALVDATGGRPLPPTARVFAYPLSDVPADLMVTELVRRGLISASAGDRSRPARAGAVNGVGMLLLSGPLASDDPPAADARASASELSGALTDAVRLSELEDAVTVAIRRARVAADGEVVSTRPVGGADEGDLAADRLAAYRRAPLIETTRSYLRHRGSWEAAARELGVHRNTIRNRIRIVQEELGIDLDDPDLSAELWIALRGPVMSARPSRPLEGYLVADLTRVLAGPTATMFLADLGARVIKVERPGLGDDTRGFGPPWAGSSSAYFESANRTKESLALDFDDPADAALARELTDRADIVVENYRTGALTRFGLDAASVRARNPRAIYASITGFGSGAGAGELGYDFLVQAVGGYMSITGQPAGEPGAGPTKVGVAVIDLLAGKDVVMAVLAAALHRERTGEGQHVEIDLLSTSLAALANQASSYLATGSVPGRLGNRHPSIAPYETVRCRDGVLALAVANERQWSALATVIGSPGLAADPRFATNGDRVENHAAMLALLEAALATEDVATWTTRLRDAGVPAGKVNDIAEAVALAESLGLDPVVEVGPHNPAQIRHPVRYSGFDPVAPVAPPALDEHGAAIREWLTTPRPS